MDKMCDSQKKVTWKKCVCQNQVLQINTPNLFQLFSLQNSIDRFDNDVH